MEYKRLGDYIEPIDERNSKLEVKLSQGISNEKYFQEPRQVAENSAADKIVRQGFFAYNRATTRNGEKISIAYREGSDCTVSSAYQVFRIKDEEKLNPRYLWMWYKRPDFDRYARFRSHGSAHEFFEYEEMCDVRIPLPSIERQREIVEEFETLSRRICLNEQMIQKLEATAQVLYRKMFVDGIDKENLPEGWRMGTLGDYVELSQGIQVEVEDQSLIKKNGFNRFIRIIDYTPNSTEPPRYVNISNKRYYATKDDVVMIRYGDAGTVCRGIEGIIANNLFKVTPTNSISRNYVYLFLKSEPIQKEIRGSAASSTMPAITHTAVKELQCVIPPYSVMQYYDANIDVLEREIFVKREENSKLKELQSLLLAKMGNLKQ